MAMAEEASRHRHKNDLSLEDVQRDAPVIFARLSPLLAMWRGGALSDPEIAFCYILVHLQHRFPRFWFGGARSEVVHLDCCRSKASFPLSELPVDSLVFAKKTLDTVGVHGPPTLLTLSHFRLRRMPLPAMDALHGWLSGDWPLRMMLSIPLPREVLDMQCRGERVVSMLVKEQELASLHFDHDPMDFLVHDLVHAHRMYGRGEEHLHAQLGVLRLLRRAYLNGCLNRFLECDPKFKKDFEYGISDMNTHCLHTLQFVKHNLMASFLRLRGMSATAVMDPDMEREFYHFFKNEFVAAWELGPLLDDAAMAALMGLCEQHAGDGDCLVKLCVGLGRAPL